MENDCPRCRWAKIFFRREANVSSEKWREKKRNTRQYHLNKTTIKATKFGMTLFNGTYLWSFLSNQKNYTILRFRSHYSIITTTIITTGYLQKFQDGLQILAYEVFENRSKKFLKKSLMPVSMFLRICEDFSYKSSSMKSVRAAAMFVSVARHHSTKHLHKCAQLLRFSISLKFKNLHWMFVSVRLYSVHLDLP